MNLMNNEQRLMQMMLQYVGWNSFVLSLMTLSNESLNDIQVCIISCRKCSLEVDSDFFILLVEGVYGV